MFPVAMRVRGYDKSTKEHPEGTYHQIESFNSVKRVRWRIWSQGYLSVAITDCLGQQDGGDAKVGASAQDILERTKEWLKLQKGMTLDGLGNSAGQAQVTTGKTNLGRLAETEGINKYSTAA